jgi:N-acetylmuramoyl-L-alanine amidase CwlA
MGDTATARWFGRRFEKGKIFDKNSGTLIDGMIESGTAGSINGGGKPFGYASTHAAADMDSVTNIIPTDEVAYNCGDAHLPWDSLYKGRQKVAFFVLNGTPNFYTVSIEICNNDIIRNSDDDWNAAGENAMCWCAAFLKIREVGIDVEWSLSPQEPRILNPGKILVLRHFDVTGKECPKPMVDDFSKWKNFVCELDAMVRQ